MNMIAKINIVTGTVCMVIGVIFMFVDHETSVNILLIGIFNLLFAIGIQTCPREP